MNGKYLAHSPTEDKIEGQLLKEHLSNVAFLSGEYARIFNARAEGEFIGILHDLGKYSDSFQRRLLGSNEKTDHSTAGAYEAFKRKDIAASFVVAGHHSGLPDPGSLQTPDDGGLLGRIEKAKRGEIENYSRYSEELQIPDKPAPVYNTETDTYFFIKNMFSCLVDADWTDTSRYFSGSDTDSTFETLSALLEKLNIYFDQLKINVRKINSVRDSIRKSVLSKADNVPGIYSLTVPTGGGKTLTSIAFALRHAIKNGMDRVIYVIPYCSILEQTGKIFCDIFGEKNVALNYSTAELKENNDKNSNAFVSERWDAPIVLTTSVQFFESLYSNKPSSSRKVHNACNSVLIFDEAQMLPVYYLRPCVLGICQMAEKYRCTAVLCTATQPSLDSIINEFLPNVSVEELCDQTLADSSVFKRVQYAFDGEILDEKLSDIIRKEKQILCIVNNRKQAQSLFKSVDDSSVFCLTTLLCPLDRSEMLGEIRRRLSEDLPCKVISTSLIEAGVDVDFPCVYRAIAGLDSIIQSGGRCNREGKNKAENSIVHVFIPESKPPRGIEQNIAVAKGIIDKNSSDICSSKAVKDYFKMLYMLKGNALDDHDILKNVKKLRFKTVSDNFKIIDGQNDCQIYIKYIGGDEYIEKIEKGCHDRTVFRKAAEFSVSTSQKMLFEFVSAGKATGISDNCAVLTASECYDRNIGLIQEFTSTANFC